MFDYAKRSGLLEKIKVITDGDVYFTISIGEKMAYAASEMIKKRGSLPYFIKNRLGYLLDSDKAAEMFAQAEGLNEKMIDILGAAKERDMMKPTIVTGGLNLAKRAIRNEGAGRAMVFRE